MTKLLGKTKRKRAISMFGCMDYPKKRYSGYVCSACRECRCTMNLKDKTMLSQRPKVCPWGTGYPPNWRKK